MLCFGRLSVKDFGIPVGRISLGHQPESSAQKSFWRKSSTTWLLRFSLTTHNEGNPTETWRLTSLMSEKWGLCRYINPSDAFWHAFPSTIQKEVLKHALSKCLLVAHRCSGIPWVFLFSNSLGNWGMALSQPWLCNIWPLSRSSPCRSAKIKIKMKVACYNSPEHQ